MLFDRYSKKKRSGKKPIQKKKWNKERESVDKTQLTNKSTRHVLLSGVGCSNVEQQKKEVMTDLGGIVLAVTDVYGFRG